MPAQLSLLHPDPFLRFLILADHAAYLANRAGRVRKRLKLDADTSPKTDAGRMRRIRIAREIAEEGGSTADFRGRVGLSSGGARKWLLNNAPEYYAVMLDARHPNVLTPHQRLARLKAVEAGEALDLPVSLIAACLGISANRLRIWLALWAPFGVEEAIELEEIGDDEALEACAA